VRKELATRGRHQVGGGSTVKPCTGSGIDVSSAGASAGGAVAGSMTSSLASVGRGASWPACTKTVERRADTSNVLRRLALDRVAGVPQELGREPRGCAPALKRPVDLLPEVVERDVVEELDVAARHPVRAALEHGACLRVLTGHEVVRAVAEGLLLREGRQYRRRAVR
jgi:hypothetical protein